MGAIQTTYTTGPVNAVAGMKADNTPMIGVTARNADAVSIPFGAITAFKTSSPTTDQDTILPAATTAKLKGIAFWETDFERAFALADGSTVGELDATGITVNGIFTDAVSGCLRVVCEDGCVPGDRLFVRISTSLGGGGLLGAARATDAGSSSCIDATTCGRWESTTAAGGFGVLRFDFSRKP